MARRRSLTADEQALWREVAKTIRPIHGPLVPDPAAVLPVPNGLTAPDAATDAVAVPAKAARKSKSVPSKNPRAVAETQGAAPSPAPDTAEAEFRAALGLSGTRRALRAAPVAAAPTPPAPAAMQPFRLGERAAKPSNGVLPGAAQTALRMDARTLQRMQRGKMAPEARIDLHGMTLAEAHPELIAFLISARGRGLRLVLVITGKGKTVHEPVTRSIGALRHQVPHWLRLAPLALIVQQVSQAHLKHGGNGAFYIWLRRG